MYLYSKSMAEAAAKMRTSLYVQFQFLGKIRSFSPCKYSLAAQRGASPARRSEAEASRAHARVGRDTKGMEFNGIDVFA